MWRRGKHVDNEKANYTFFFLLLFYLAIKKEKNPKGEIREIIHAAVFDIHRRGVDGLLSPKLDVFCIGVAVNTHVFPYSHSPAHGYFMAAPNSLQPPRSAQIILLAKNLSPLEVGGGRNVAARSRQRIASHSPTHSLFPQHMLARAGNDVSNKVTVTSVWKHI